MIIFYLKQRRIFEYEVIHINKCIIVWIKLILMIFVNDTGKLILLNIFNWLSLVLRVSNYWRRNRVFADLLRIKSDINFITSILGQLACPRFTFEWVHEFAWACISLTFWSPIVRGILQTWTLCINVREVKEQERKYIRDCAKLPLYWNYHIMPLIAYKDMK